MAVDVDGLHDFTSERVETVEGDVADPSVIERMVEVAVGGGRTLDVLINNAGIGVERRIEDHASGEFERVLAVNLFGPFHGMHAAIPVMRAQGRGRIINMISRHAEFAPAGLAGYSASKAALWALTRTAADETKDADILVNAMIPGPTKTAMNPRGTQPPEAVYPTARMLATLPSDGPTGKCFWDLEEYLMYQPVKRHR